MRARAYDPVPRRLVSDAVHDRLRADILDERLHPGDALPSERALSEQFAVNRHAVREALKRLQQAGLVHVAQGGATRVADWRRVGGLELLADLAREGRRRADLLLAAAEMRATVGADAARLCCLRADAAVRDEIARLGRIDENASYAERLEAYERLWECIVDGSGNLAYRLALNSLIGARHGQGVDPAIYAAEVDDPAAIGRLAKAVAGADPARAASVAETLLGRTVMTAQEAAA